MKRQFQKSGTRAWFGNDFVDLQAEALKIADAFFSQFGSFIVSGCEVTPNGDKYDVAAGLVVLHGADPEGKEVRLVVPFDGTESAQTLPLYLTLGCTVKEAAYSDGESRPVAYDYKAVASSVRPDGSCLEIEVEGTPRFIDAIQDPQHLLVSDAEKTNWDSKASTDLATAIANGLMSSADKSKLDEIELGANNYVHPATHPAEIIIEDDAHHFITDAERALWNSKETPAGAQAKADVALADAKEYADGKDAVTLVDAKEYADTKETPAGAQAKADVALADAKEYADEKNVVVLASAKTYADEKDAVTLVDAKAYADTKETPASAQAKADAALADAKEYADEKDAVVLVDAKTYADTKAPNTPASTSAAGLMSAADKAKLDGVAAGANNYIHPSNHSATMIVEDTTHRFATDAEKATWNGKASTAVASTTANGLMSAADKSKLDGVAAGANNYVHPNDANTRHVTDAEKATWNGKETPAGAQAKADAALASANTYTNILADGALANAKIYADTKETPAGAQAKASNAYIDANTYADGKDATTLASAKAYADTKASTTAATSSAAGLMSAADKAKLDGVAAGANNYVHPNDANTRHVTDAEKSTWNGKASTAMATQSTNGLMSAADKKKLDGTYDYVVDSDAKLAALNNNKNVKSVFIAPGTWSFYSSAGQGILLAATVKSIVGAPGSELVFYNMRNAPCLLSSDMQTNDFRAEGIRIRIAKGTMSYCFGYMRNLYNCIGSQNSTAGAKNSMFYVCTNLYSCEAKPSFKDTNTSGFDSCSQLFGCTVSTTTTHGYAGCSYLSYCEDYSTNLDSFYICGYMLGCNGRVIKECKNVLQCSAFTYTSSYSSTTANSLYLCADTPAGGWNS